MKRKSAYLLAGFVLVLSTLVSVFVAGRSWAQTATQFSGLTVTPGSTQLGATTTYTFSFTAPRVLTADDPENQQPGDTIMVEFMSNGPENDSTKIDLSNASLGSNTNVNASLQTADPSMPRERNIVLAQDVASGATVAIELTGVVNPSTAGQYSGRVSIGGPSGGSYYASQNLVLGMGTTYTVSGQVTLRATSAGVADARVQAEPSTGGSSSFGVDADSSGNYSMPLPAGNWKFRVEAQWDQSTGDQKDVNWAYIGAEDTTTVSADTTVNLQVSPTTKTISGKVTYAGTSTPVTDAQVNANLRRGMGWRSASTDSSGNYTLKVPGGEWEVRVEPQWQDGSRVAVDWAYSGRGEMVSFASDTSSESSTVNISVVKATATVKGKLLDPDGNVADGWIDLRSKDGAGVGGGVDFDTGVFSISVPAGSYNVGIWVNDQTLAAPEISSFTVADNQTQDLGTITLVKKTSKITGSVLDKDTGAGIAGVRVNAWSPEGSGWAETTSGSDGSYTLTVGAGTYEVMAEPSSEIGYASTQAGPPTRIKISNNQTVSKINFKLVQANNVIGGTVVDANGNQLTSFFGFAMAMEGDGDPPKPGPGGPAEGGSFSLAVPDGTWTVNVETEPGSDYSSTGGKTVTVSGGQTASVTITMKENDAAITGTVKDEDGNAVTGVRTEVFAENGRGSFKFTNVDPSDGTYNLGVVGGDSWYLGVFVEPSSGYMMLPPTDSKVTVNSGETVTKNFALLKANATISGKVTDPDGNGLSGVFVFADTNMVDDGAVLGLSTIDEGGPGGGPGGKLDTGVHTGDLADADGNYTLEVPAGTYGVGSGAPASLGYINPEFQRVEVAKGGSATGVNLQYRASDATISGTVRLNGEKAEAFVWAWSETGAHSEVDTRTGDYTLNVTKGEVWHVGADYEANQKFYQSGEFVVDLSDGSTSATKDLTLSESDFTLPPSVSQQIDAAQGGTIILEDGLRVVIPAGAFGSSGTYTVTITPTAQLAKEKNRRPLAFGYRITALDSNGQELSQSFNSNVRLVIPYTDAMLTAMGITEDNLNADFFDSTSSAWQGVDSFTVNKDENTVVASISHFTDFALTTGAAGTLATPTSTPTPTTAPTATPTPTSAALPATGVPIGEALGFYLTRLLGLVGLTAPAYIALRKRS